MYLVKVVKRIEQKEIRKAPKMTEKIEIHKPITVQFVLAVGRLYVLS